MGIGRICRNSSIDIRVSFASISSAGFIILTNLDIDKAANYRGCMRLDLAVRNFY